MTFLLAFAFSLAHAEARFPVVDCEGVLAEEFSRRPILLRPQEGLLSLRRSDTVTFGPKVTLEAIEAAYRNGLFPWGTVTGNRGKWSHPRQRGVLLFSELKIPRKDRQYIERNLGSGKYIFTENEDFEQIMTACARNFRYSWITPEMIEAYGEAFDAGHVVADAAWVDEGNGKRGELVAAMYGIDIDGNYSGESMVHFRPDVLKLLMYRRIKKLEEQGREFMDVQEAIQRRPDERKEDFRPSLSVKWGARPIPRKDYLRLMRAAQERHRSMLLGGVR